MAKQKRILIERPNGVQEVILAVAHEPSQVIKEWSLDEQVPADVTGPNLGGWEKQGNELVFSAARKASNDGKLAAQAAAVATAAQRRERVKAARGQIKSLSADQKDALLEDLLAVLAERM